MLKIEAAFATGLEIEGRKLSGVALPYGKVGYPSGGIPTVIKAGAFGTIGDVLLNVHHDKARVIARTPGTMTLTDTRDALQFEATLPETREADDVIANVRAGVLAGLSIEAGATVHAMRKGIRVVERATLTGLAVVARPGFKETSVKVAADAGQGRPLAPWVLL